MALTDEIQEVIASALTDYVEVEVVKLSYSLWGQDLYLTSQLDSGFELTDDTGTYQVDYVPMKLSQESNQELVSNTRDLNIQGINDVVSYYEDLTDTESEERIVCEVLLYIVDRDMVASSVQASFKYFVTKVDYSQKNNSATLRISTTPTNTNETGIRFSSALFPSMAGLE